MKAKEIVKLILQRFRTLLIQLSIKYSNVVYVPTQGVLKPTHGDWANELHPTETGFDKIAKAFFVELKNIFGSRI